MAKKTVPHLVHVCREIDINQYNSFTEFSMDVLNGAVDLYASNNFCYLYPLTGSEQVPVELIPVTLEVALRRAAYANASAAVLISVNSNEKNYKEWLEQAENYPGASIMALDRGSRTVYALIFPSIPV